jgi:hypothetical protein
MLGASTLPALATAARIVTSPFRYDFHVDGTLEETGSMNDSSSPYFWLNSGGYMPLRNGLGMTAQGTASPKWRTLYAAANPLDTDNGTHPQNLFRLVTRSQWQNFQQEAYFKITADNFSASPNRDGHNGLLLFNRYAVDGQTLYYAGVRVDGTAVIKKKLNSTYTTLAQKAVFPGTYNRAANTNLIPHNTWIGIRTVVRTNANGSTTIDLYTDVGRTGTWTKALTATDAGTNGRIISEPGFGGIRTDFMDVQFDDYSMKNI